MRKLYLTLLLFSFYFGLTAGIAPYCNPSHDPGLGGAGYDIGIANVTLGGINNTSTVPGNGICDVVAPYSVVDYTNTVTYGTANLTQGSSYSLSVTVGSDYLGCGGAPTDAINGVKAWIDWNGDGDFSDSNEYLGVVNGIVPNGVATITFNVPSGATPGNTRMRVYAEDAGYWPATDACIPAGDYYGELEDYTVNVVACVGANMSFTSCNTTQANTSTVYAGDVNAEILGIQVVTANSCNALSSTRMKFNTAGTNGSTAASTDLVTAKLYYTFNSGTFGTSTLLGTYAGPNGAFAIDYSQQLAAGTNYFWLTYELSVSAASGDFVDVACDSVKVAGANNKPTATSPIGSRTIAIKTYSVNSTNDVDDGTCDGTHCSLREAINAANGDGLPSIINFALTGSSPFTILPTSKYATITEKLTIDGTSQSGFSGTPIVELKGTLAGNDGGVGVNGLKVQASNCVIKGLVSNQFTGAGFRVTGNNNIISGNYIGIDPTGTINKANSQTGIYISGDDNTIGGTTAASRNVVSGNDGTSNICVSWNRNIISGNYIGTNASGNAAISANGYGIYLSSCINCTVGGSSSNERNIISGNAASSTCCGSAIRVQSSNYCIIAGNYIGTNVNGTAAIPNGQGIYTNITNGNTIGGSTSNERNIISGNAGAGMVFGWGSDSDVVVGNYIGTDVNGTADLGNSGDGISIECPATYTFIGGSIVGQRNLISGNNKDGITIYSAGSSWPTRYHSIKGNYIGLDKNGAALGNTLNGIYIKNDYCRNNVIGDITGVSPNIIANNGNNGILINGTLADSNLITRNLIYSNGAAYKPINLNGTGNANWTKPTITGATTSSVTGTVPAGNAGDSIEVYRSSGTVDASCLQAEVYLGTTVAVAGGGWTLNGLSLSGEIVKATARKPSTKNTSEFSNCLTAPLPVELLTFTAEALDNKYVLTKWVTTTEINNDYFDLEKSIDGNYWEVEGTIRGAGNSNAELSYSYTDTNPYQGVSHYRIRQVDFDGKQESFEPVSVTVGNKDGDFTIFPNPSTESNLFLRFSQNFKEQKQVLIVVYNTKGEEIYSKVIVTESKGQKVFAVDPSEKLAPGIYMVVASSDNKIFRQKLIVQ